MTATSAARAVSPRLPDILARELESRIGSRKYAMWFDRSARWDYEPQAGEVTLAVPNRYNADWVRKHFLTDIHAAAEATVGPGTSVQIDVRESLFTREPVVRANSFSPPSDNASAQGAAPAKPRSTAWPAAAPSPAVAPSTTRQASPLASVPLRYDLDRFVVGPSNQLAHTAALNFARSNPQAPGLGELSTAALFIHGGCGLGKTHLLQGLCRAALQQQPGARVVYTTGEQFTNAFIRAVRTNKLEPFRRHVRNLHLLAIDDVHFVASKEKTQQELLHSIDQLELGGHRLALASDSHPRMIQAFSESLISRCVRGLVVQIQPPDESTRRVILKKLALRRGMVLHPPAAEALAQKLTGSVREIEGALAKLHALATLADSRNVAGVMSRPVGLALVEQLMQDQPNRPKRLIRFDDALALVAQRFHLDAAQLLGNGRHQMLVQARAMLIYLVRTHTPMSYPEIARAMGRKNHSGVITALQRFEKQLESGTPIKVPESRDGVPPQELVHELTQRLMTEA